MWTCMVGGESKQAEYGLTAYWLHRLSKGTTVHHKHCAIVGRTSRYGSVEDGNRWDGVRYVRLWAMYVCTYRWYTAAAVVAASSAASPTATANMEHTRM